MIDTHYARLRLVDRWSWERYVRLCQFLQMTPWEVASLVTLSHGAVEGFKRRGTLFGPGHRGIALILTLLEAHVMSAWTSDVVTNPFPDVSQVAPREDDSATELLRERARVARAARGLRRTSPSSLHGSINNGEQHSHG